MAQTLSYDSRIIVAGITVSVRAIVDTVSNTAADAISVSGHSETSPAPFASDPTWDSFMENIEKYSRYIDSLERTSHE